MPARLVVMISGKGTNLQAIQRAVDKKFIPAEISLVVSNRREAAGLEFAAQHEIPTLYFPLKPYTDAGKPREDYDAALAEKVAEVKPHLVVLAGWMHILSPAFLDQFPDRVINLHPALPGMFPGRDAISRAFEAYKRGEIKYSGCMVHRVTAEVDAGKVIQKIVVPIRKNDTPEQFEQRVHQAEHYIIGRAIRKTLSELNRQYQNQKKLEAEADLKIDSEADEEIEEE